MTRFNNIAFARELARAKRLGLTAKEISKQSGVACYKLTNWKLGRLAPTREAFAKVAQVLNVPVEAFWEEVKPTTVHNKDEEDLAVFKAIAASLHIAQNVATLCRMAFDLWEKEHFPQC